MNKNNTVIILVGNIGSGKTTVCEKLYSDLNTIKINRDDLREGFGGLVGIPYLWDETLEGFINSMSLDGFEASLYLNAMDIIIDGTNMTRKQRGPYIDLALKYGFGVQALVFQNLGKEEHIRRRMTNPRGFDKEHWEKIYDKFQDSFEGPNFDEGFTDIRFAESS